MSEKILPCPICGNHGQVVPIWGTEFWMPRCTDPMCILHVTDSEWHNFTIEEAVKAWNTRH